MAIWAMLTEYFRVNWELGEEGRRKNLIKLKGERKWTQIKLTGHCLDV